MRYKKITPFLVMDLVSRAKEYKEVIYFEIGEPALKPSSLVSKALKEAVDNEIFGYTPTEGLYELREKISSHYKREYNLEIDPSLILVTPGTSNAFLIAYLLTLNQGDTLGISDPSYPCYKNFATMVDVEVKRFNIDKSTNYMIRSSMLEGQKINALHISTPSNPTGNIYEDEVLEELINYCKDNKISFISDELYHGLVYDKKPKSALNFSRDVIVINGFSKYFCMPGLRVGWMILPPNLIKSALNIAQNLYLSAPTISQYGAISAFDYSYLDYVKAEYKRRRDYLYSELSSIFEIEAKPDGAFYLWCDISKYSSNGVDFSYELLDNIQVAITPGVDFGDYNTKTKLRFSYSRSIEHMREGVRRLREYLL